jgi:molecular chaperone GrpE
MFFKKKKNMSDNAFEKEGAVNDTPDNMAQPEETMDEALANELNTDDSASGTTHLNDTVEEESEYEKLREELQEAKDKYLRLVAEFENFRKRNAKERLELTQTAGKDIIQSLLDVVDDSDRAAKQMETSTDLETIKQGISLVFNKLRNTLQQKGLKAMDSMNQPFNPDLHEAITEIPAPNEDMIGKVMDVIQPGYYLNDKLIRHAKVVVGK